MYNNILDGAAARLGEHFPGITIYTDTPEQGLIRPCFFIRISGGSQKPMIGRRVLCRTTVNVQYHPEKTAETARELNRAADSLVQVMEYITLEDGSVLHGTDMKQDFTEGQLDFSAGYNRFVIRPGAEEEAMDALETQPELRRE